jgi:hypothetical protein
MSGAGALSGRVDALAPAPTPRRAFVRGYATVRGRALNPTAMFGVYLVGYHAEFPAELDVVVFEAAVEFAVECWVALVVPCVVHCVDHSADVAHCADHCAEIDDYANPALGLLTQ